MPAEPRRRQVGLALIYASLDEASHRFTWQHLQDIVRVTCQEMLVPERGSPEAWCEDLTIEWNEARSVLEVRMWLVEAAPTSPPAWTVWDDRAVAPGAALHRTTPRSTAASASRAAMEPVGDGDCDGRVTLDDWHHQDHDEGVLAYDPTWDDCDGEGGPVKTGPRCGMSGPYYTPCTYADCDLELGGGCVLRGPSP